MIRSILHSLLLINAILLLQACATSRTEQASRQVNSEANEDSLYSTRQLRIHQLEQPELRLPRAVWSAQLAIRLESASDLGEITFTVQGADNQTVSIAATSEEWRRGFLYAVEAPIADWPDGTITVQAHNSEGEPQGLASTSLIRQQADAWSDNDQGESLSG